MSRLPEQRLWDRARTNLAAFRRIRLERFENLVNVGTPDTMALCRGIVTWIEMKAVDEAPVRETTRLLPSGKGLSQDQMNWHLDWTQNGGRSIILVGVGSSINLAVEGRFGDQLNHMTFNEISKAAIAATWSELAFHLGWRP